MSYTRLSIAFLNEWMQHEGGIDLRGIGRGEYDQNRVYEILK